MGIDTAPTAGKLRSNDLRHAVDRLFDAGRMAWPQFDVDAGLFERYVTRHASGETPPGDIYAADMYLACACAHGVNAALAVLERTLEGNVARAVASIDSSHAFVEDVLQTVRERLLVRRDDEPGKISEYAGRASLRTWLCAVAVRCAISQRRLKGEQCHADLAVEDDRRLAKGGPEFDYLRRRYKGAFEEAVRGAIERLSSKERALLRLNLVEGMSIDRLGTVYQVGRSTAARWLASARRALLEEARRKLRENVRLTSTELESLSAAMHSQLDVSILRLLGRTTGSLPRDAAGN
jgi:RNA polymerase sigma-70 factor (ECF subfamily)